MKAKGILAQILKRVNCHLYLHLSMMQAICGFLAERDIDLDARAFPRRGINIEQAIYKFACARAN